MPIAGSELWRHCVPGGVRDHARPRRATTAKNLSNLQVLRKVEADVNIG
jgi:hypothetical protein